MNNKLPIENIIAIAKRVAGQLGITMPHEAVLMNKLNMQNPYPLVVKSNLFTLWIDRYYIAYSHDDETEIHYVYVSQHHIKEEWESYLGADGASLLPGHIEEQFKFALERMETHEQKYWIMNRKAAGDE